MEDDKTIWLGEATQSIGTELRLEEGKGGASHVGSGEKGPLGKRREHHVQRPWGRKECGISEKLSSLSPQSMNILEASQKNNPVSFQM